MVIRVRRRRKIAKKGVLYDLERDGITQTILRTFMECRRKAELMLLGLSPKKRSGALDFGSFTHDVLEFLYTEAQQAYPEPWIPELPLMTRVVKVREEWLRSNEYSTQDDAGLQALERDAGILETLLPHYVRMWTQDFNGALEWTNLESEFCVPAPGHPNVPLRGKFDGNYQRKRALWLFETKTKGRIDGEGLSNALPLDLQVHFYLYALAKQTGRKPRGVLYNIIRRPQLRQGKNETLKAFLNRIDKDIEKRPDHYFTRFEVPISRDEMKVFDEELTSMVDDFVQWQHGVLKTYKNGSACLRPWACQFLPVCGQGSTDGFYVRDRVFPELVAKTES
jgi:hypothetical protein